MVNLDRLEFEFHGAGWATLPPGATFGPRTLKDYEFLWMLEGHSIAEWDGVRYDLPPGSFSLIRPGTRDYYEWDKKVKTQGVYVHFYFKHRGLALPPESAWPATRVLPEGDVLRPLMRHVLWLLDHRSPERMERVQSAMRLMLGAYLSGDVQTGGTVARTFPPPVVAALRQISERLNARKPAPTVGELARAAHLSEGHLGRLFRTSLGYGPAEAVRLVRLDHAAALLATSNLPSKEIARLTGFANPFHFSRCFRGAFGIPPRAYRRQYLEGGVVPHSRLQAVRVVAPFE
ncbi:MAG: helix-turn-helix domain-containing protein [Planctomycetota bacterium]|nr:helix-turn-helix domain-containing protein [Planctomycetota bacterium]